MQLTSNFVLLFSLHILTRLCTQWLESVSCISEEHKGRQLFLILAWMLFRYNRCYKHAKTCANLTKATLIFIWSLWYSLRWYFQFVTEVKPQPWSCPQSQASAVYSTRPALLQTTWTSAANGMGRRMKRKGIDVFLLIYGGLILSAMVKCGSTDAFFRPDQSASDTLRAVLT